MSESPKRKKRMNALGYISIALSLGIMMYVKYQSLPESTVIIRLIEGIGTYILCFISAGLVTVLLWIGMYAANLFTNAIYDEDKEPPTWENSDHLMLVLFAIIYILQIIGKDIAIV